MQTHYFHISSNVFPINTNNVLAYRPLLFKNKFIKIAKLVNNKTINLNKECKENGELYGSIKPKEIANLIKAQINAEVTPSQINLKENINKIGLFKASINFHSEVQASISVKIDKIQSK